MVKRHTFNVRLDDDGKARLTELANKLGIDVADAARYAIKQAHDYLIVAAKATQSTR